MQAAGAAVELTGVSHVYRDDPAGPPVQALADIDLTIDCGQLVALVGPSGSGKSTLLHVIGAVTTPSLGSVTIAGQALGGLDPARRAQLRGNTIGFIFQAFNLVGHLTVAQNVALPAVIAGRPARDYRRRVDELLDLVGLAELAGRRPAQLSGGEQQRVAVARALVNDPQVLLADEPTGNLDTRTGVEIVALLQASHAAGRTVVLVTHDLRLASQAQRIMHLRDGRISHESRPSEVSADRALADLLRTGEAHRS